MSYEHGYILQTTLTMNSYKHTESRYRIYLCSVSYAGNQFIMLYKYGRSLYYKKQLFSFEN